MIKWDSYREQENSEMKEEGEKDRKQQRYSLRDNNKQCW